MAQAAIRDEKGVKKAVRKLLETYGWFSWMPPAGAWGVSGQSDICCVKHGQFMAIETKFGYNKPSPQQHMFLTNIYDAGGFALMVNEKNIYALDVFLLEFNAGNTAGATAAMKELMTWMG